MNRNCSVYQLWRQDDNGNQFKVGEFTVKCAADEMLGILSVGGHKQIYWIVETERENVDSD